MRANLREMWTRRLNGCAPDVDVWQAMMQVRSMVISPTEDVAAWLKFSELFEQLEVGVPPGAALQVLEVEEPPPPPPVEAGGGR